MIKSLIVAIGKNNQLGLNNDLLWHIKDDLLHFKRLTKGHHIIMGRKTFESIGCLLPFRTSIIVSHNKDLKIDGAFVVASIDEAFELAANRGETEAFVIGGASIYAAAITVVDKMYISKVDYAGVADCFFPKFDEERWIKSELFHADKSSVNDHAFTAFEFRLPS